MTTDSLVVTHSLPLRGADARKLTAILSAKPGIRSILTGEDGRNAAITYDLLLLSLSDIETAVDAAGAKEPLGMLKKVRLGWTKFTEQNVRDRMLAPIRDCCNRPPAGR
ncbi:MAG: hypothetical protein WC722_12570 [Rhodospirillales bacterium]|jgi:hypothetical protein